MRAVDVGMSVIGYDVNEDRVAHLSRGQSYIDDVSNNEVSSRPRHGPISRDYAGAGLLRVPNCRDYRAHSIKGGCSGFEFY